MQSSESERPGAVRESVSPGFISTGLSNLMNTPVSEILHTVHFRAFFRELECSLLRGRCTAEPAARYAEGSGR